MTALIIFVVKDTIDPKTPHITDADIERLIKRDFSPLAFSEVAQVLKKYTSETKLGENRVYAAALKLAKGDIALLTKYVDKANNDYRDIIALSEYPNYSSYAFDDNLSDEQAKQLIDADWNQYEAWLNKV
jgi:hypothetical protein